MIAHWETYGFGLHILRPKDDAFVGYAGLRRVHVGDDDEIEILYALAAPFWNRGLATEFAIAFRELALGDLRLPSVVAFTLPTNLASRRVMEKAGLVYERDVIWRALPHVLYRANGGKTEKVRVVQHV
jgi:RimJ/RimL family protein N-acetyltransferase